MIGGISVTQLLILLVIVMLVFGTKRLRNIGSDLGSAIKGFRKGIEDEPEDNEPEKITAAEKTTEEPQNKRKAPRPHAQTIQMFDIGFAELFLLSLIGLLVLGPERLPGVARTLGGFVRKARASWISLRNTIQSELNEADLSNPIKKAGDELKQIGKEFTDVAGFKPEKQESVFPEENQVETPDQEPVVAKDSAGGKDEDV